MRVILNSLRGWIQRWESLGLVGLHEEHREGRPSKLSPAVAECLRQVVTDEGGTIGHIMQCMEKAHMPLQTQPDTVARWLKGMGFSYKRYRASLKKRDPDLVAGFRQQLEEVMPQVRAGELAQCFFDECGFSPNPPLQSGWSLHGQTRDYRPVSHGQRVNVLGCLQKGVRLVWETLTHTVVRDDVMAFLDQLASQITQKAVVVLDNAAIHRGEPMRNKQAQWEKKGVYLMHLPPYSPEFNAIEILWKQAKYFWRRFCTWSGTNYSRKSRP